MSVLRGIEHRIESLVEGIFGRAFRSHVQPVELARKLVKEMDDHRTVSVSRVYVPNEYVLYLSPRDREQFRGYESSLLGELADYLAEHARREGYALLSPPRVLLEEDADLSVGEFGIATRLVQPSRPEREAVPSPPSAVAGGTRVYGPQELPEPRPATPPAAPRQRAVLLVAGTPHELDRPVLTVGRSNDCDIVVGDPSVSRRHAEVRLEPDGYWIVDLGSTNGVEMNGRRVDRAKLEAGAQITLGQTELRFERSP